MPAPHVRCDPLSVSAGLDEFLCEQLVGHCDDSQVSDAGAGDSEVREEL